MFWESLLLRFDLDFSSSGVNIVGSEEAMA